MAKALVIGGGMGGCCAAHFLSKVGVSVDLVERAPFLGGGVKTFFHGGHPYTVGPRHFLTTKERNFEFLNQYVPMRRIQEHEFLTYIERDASFYNFPIHREDIERMPDRKQILTELEGLEGAGAARDLEEYWLASVGPTLYSKFVETYTKKMWQIESNTMLTDFKFDGKGVALRTGTKQVRPEFFVGYPYDLRGWDPFFEQLAATPGITLRLNTRVEAFNVQKPAVRVAGEWLESDILVSSVSPDFLFDCEYGTLEYIGRDFMKLVLPVENVIPDPTFFLHYPNDEVFTRVVEYKKMTGYKSPSTLLGIEFPSTKNKLYPYPITVQQDLAARYLGELPDTVFSIGRMGNYRYLDIGSSIEEALRRIEDL